MQRREFLAGASASTVGLLAAGCAMDPRSLNAAPAAAAYIDVPQLILSKLPSPMVTNRARCSGPVYPGTPVRNTRVYRVDLVSVSVEWLGDAETLPPIRVEEEYSQINCTLSPRDWREDLEMRKKVEESTRLVLTSPLRADGMQYPFKPVTTIDLPETKFLRRQESINLAEPGTGVVREVQTDVRRRAEVVIPANTVGVVKLRKTLTTTRRRLVVRVVFEAGLAGDFNIPHCSVRGFNMKASEYLSPEQRTVEVEGYLEETSASALSLIFVDRPTTAADC